MVGLFKPAGLGAFVSVRDEIALMTVDVSSLTLGTFVFVTNEGLYFQLVTDGSNDLIWQQVNFGGGAPVASDIRAVLAAQARQFLGDHFQLTIYTFDTTFWEPYINNSNTALAVFTPGLNAPTIDFATGTSSSGSVWLRVAGTGIRSDPSGLLLSNWTGAAAKGQQVFNPQTGRWFIAAVCNFRGESPGNSHKWPVALTSVDTDPKTAIAQTGLDYTGGTLKIRAWQAGATIGQIDTGWTDDTKPHLFALGSDSVSMRALVDGTQVGLSLSSYAAVQSAPSFVNWGAHTGNDGTNYQTNWSLIAVATPTESL